MSTYFKIDPNKILAKKGITLNTVQKQIIDSVNNNVLSCAICTRRGGKSLIAGACAAAKLLEPGIYGGLVAPNMSQTDIVFGEVVETFKDILDIKPTKLNNKDRYIALDWGSELRANTLRNRKAIAGRAYDIYIGDEVGLADEDDDSWLYQEIMPAMITTQGHILIISTPRGLNHLYSIWEAAEREKNWNRIRYTIHDCEHIPKDEIAKMERLYKERGMEKLWAQEFLAEFITFEGAIFSFQPQIVKTAPEPDLIITGTDPGSVMGFVKVYINKKHGVFVVLGTECEASTLEQGKLLQEHTIESDLNVYDHADKRFCTDMSYEFDISLTKAIKDVDAGINFLRRLEGKLFFLDTVDEVLVRDWANYHMKNDRIVKKGCHALDALRYALYSAYVYWPEYFEGFLNPEVESLWD